MSLSLVRFRVRTGFGVDDSVGDSGQAGASSATRTIFVRSRTNALSDKEKKNANISTRGQQRISCERNRRVEIFHRFLRYL